MGSGGGSRQQQQQQQQQQHHSGSHQQQSSSSGGGAANNNSVSSDDNNTQLSPSSQQNSVPVSGSGPLHIPAKRLGSGGNTVPTGSSSGNGSYHHSSHGGGAVDPNGGVNGSVDSSGGTGGLLRAQPWPYSVGDVAAQHAAATGSFDPQSYSPSSMAAAAAGFSAPLATAAIARSAGGGPIIASVITDGVQIWLHCCWTKI